MRAADLLRGFFTIVTYSSFGKLKVSLKMILSLSEMKPDIEDIEGFKMERARRGRLENSSLL